MCRKPVGTGLPDGPSCEHAKQRAIRESILLALSHHTSQKVFCSCSATPATPFCSLYPPLAAVANVPLRV